MHLSKGDRRFARHRASGYGRFTRMARIPSTILEEASSTNPTEPQAPLFIQPTLKRKRTASEANMPSIFLKSWSRMLIPQFFWNMVNCLMLFNYSQEVFSNDFLPCKCGCILMNELVCAKCNWSCYLFLFNKRQRAVFVLTEFISDISRIVKKVGKDVAMLLRYELVIQAVKLHISSISLEGEQLIHLHTIFIANLCGGNVPFDFQEILEKKWKNYSKRLVHSLNEDQLKLYNENTLYLGGASPAHFKKEVTERFSESVVQLL